MATYLIGTDEAGYGPNFGPLVVAATVWQVDHDEPPIDLYQQLQQVVTTEPDGQRLAIADSKRLYRPGGELRLLEQGVFTALRLLDRRPVSFRQLVTTVCPQVVRRLDSIPWYQDFDIPLPTGDVGQQVAESIDHWQAALDASQVRLIDAQCVLVFPQQFNEGIDHYDSKGALLSHTTLDLVARLVDRLPAQRVRIVCDKHGGRNRYGPLLQPRFGNRLVRVCCEGRQSSVYDVGTKQQPIRISFEVGGESFLPSALASMFAKYLRELSMRAFNHFWTRHVPDLRPTAGYPVDAKRFKHQIATAQSRLSIDDRCLWRRR